MRAPTGLYLGEYSIGHSRYRPDMRYKATGEFRPPHLGEYFLSGAEIIAYRAVTDSMTVSYWIAEPVMLESCPTCGGRGQVEGVRV